MGEAAELAADLGYLPLALAQAATFIRDRHETCAGYRRRLVTNILSTRHDLAYWRVQTGGAVHND